MVTNFFFKLENVTRKETKKRLPPQTGSSRELLGGVGPFSYRHVEFSIYNSKTMFDLAKEEKESFSLPKE